MEDLKKLIENYMQKDKPDLVASLLSSYDWVVKIWSDAQPKDKIFQFGALAQSPDSTMELIEKTIDEMSDTEKSIQTNMYIRQQLNY